MRDSDAPVRPQGRGTRGQASVLAVALIIGITVIGVTSVLVFGSTALTDANTRSEVDAAEHAMTQLDSRLSLVALGSSSRQGATVPTDGSGNQLTVDETRGWMNVSVTNETGARTNIMNVTMGAITYQNDDTTIAYQGGGVWRSGTGGGSAMVSPPEFHYRRERGQDPTVTLPLVRVTGSGSVGQSLSVTRTSTVGKYPDPGNDALTNPLTGGEVEVRVGSEFYRAWGAFFEERTGGTVTYDYDSEVVTITLVVPTYQPAIQGGIVSGVSGNVLRLRSNFEIDSYNSSVGPYSPASNGTIVTAGNVEMESNSRIDGTLKTAGTVDMASNSEIAGDLYYGSPPTMSGNARVLGDQFNDPPEVDVSPVGGTIDGKLSDLKEDNDSDSVADISNSQLQNCGDASGCEVPAGEYYLKSIDLEDDDRLVLDNSGGDITIAVDGEVQLDTIEGIEVTDGNGGTVRIYVGSDSSNAFRMDSNSEVTVPDDKSPLFWVYGRPGFEAQFNSDSVFVGVIYAPGTQSKPGRITCDSNGVVFGGLVGTVDEVDSNCEIHFDEALTKATALPGSPSRAKITYLHISVVDIEAGGE